MNTNMKRKILFIYPLLLLITSCSRGPIIDTTECVNELSSEEKQQGWHSLFDGTSLEQWRSYKEDSVNSGWAVENGCLTRVGWGGDLITREQFANYELKLEWRISEAGNSGIFIRGDESGRSIHHTGFEMQVLDNAGHSDAEDPSHRSGAYYDMIVPDHDTSKPVGYWNKVHIIANGADVEFRLNGRTTAKFQQGSPEWQALYQQSKFTDRHQYGSRFKGHIGLQDHMDKVWYRNLRILVLPD